jgi:hypothetical protein
VEHLSANPPRNNKDKHRAEVAAILQGLELVDNATAAEWYTFVGDASWHRDAHRDDLWLPRAPDEISAQRFELFVAALLAVLDRAEAKYNEVLEALDVVCARDAPSDDDVAFAATHLAPGATAVAHVFEKLSPKWLNRLREKGVFKAPPDVHFHEDGSYSFPSWPQAGYLARLAIDLPEAVASTIEQVPIVDNESIHGVFLYAGSRMPPACAARVARHEAPWLGTHRWGPLPAKRVGELAHCLLGGDEIDAALDLARRALSLLPHDGDRSWRGPDARVESLFYRELARDVIGGLAAKSPGKTFALLYELLDARDEQRRELGQGPIAGGTRLQADDPFSILFAELRNLFEARAGSGALKESVAELRAHGVALYDRLAVHLIRLHGNGAPKLVWEHARDEAKLFDEEPDGELAQMIRGQLSSLAPIDQQCVFAAIRVSALREREYDRPASEEAPNLMARWRLLRWWHELHDKLPNELLQEYEELRHELGEPPPKRSDVWFGPTAPVNASDLFAQSDDALIGYLREWVPAESRFFEPSREGLGREVQSCVRRDVTRFSRLARAFIGLAAPYVSCLLWGLHDSEKVEADGAPKAIDWHSIQSLLDWAASQPGPEWAGTRTMALKVAEDLIAASSTTEEQRAAWLVIRALMGDADPPEERDANYDNDDEVDRFAINTVRGQAVGAGIRCAELLKRTDPSREQKRLFDEVLDAIQLRAREEPCTAIRTVLARYFNNIHILSTDVAASIAMQLFPCSSDSSNARRTLWRSFVLRNHAHRSVFATLREAYQVAVASIAAEQSEVAGTVGAHLAFLVLSDPHNAEFDHLLSSFVDGCAANVRLLALQEIGRAVHNSSDEPEVSERLKTFWEWWANRIQNRDDRSDLQAFGWWFTSPLFETEWTFPALAAALATTRGEIDWDHAVVQKLRELATTSPSDVAACLGMLIDGPDHWWVARHDSAVQAILSALQNTSASVSAQEIASRLVARGHAQFRSPKH